MAQSFFQVSVDRSQDYRTASRKQADVRNARSLGQFL
jgi:hypothetical protein